MLQLEEIRDSDRLEALRPDWQALWERCPEATPFQLPDWLLPWWQCFAPGELRTLAFWDGNRLAGLAPLFLERKIVPLGIGISDYLDLLVEPALVGPVLDVLEDWLSGQACDWQEIPPTSPLLKKGGQFRLTEFSACPYAALPGSWEEFEAGLGAGMRRNLRRYRERLGASFETSTSGEALEACLCWHAQRWPVGDAELHRFYRLAAGGFARLGILRLHAIRVERRIAGAMFAFCSRGRTYSYLGGFDPALSRFSPGTLLTAYAISQAIAENCREYDFLRGRETYKYEFQAHDRGNYRFWRAAGV